VIRKVRAVWRLTRAIVHTLHGALVVHGQFRFLNQEQRWQKVQWWGEKQLRMLGVKLVVEGTPRPGAKLLVANHISWLDIMAMHAVLPARFISKSEVASWPVVGALVTAGSSLYLQRGRPRDALRVLGVVADALRAGDTVAVFPEGTTSDGTGLLPFHANMLQSAIDAQAPVQPVALRYRDSTNEISPAVAYIGDTSLGQSLWWIACADGLEVKVSFLPARQVAHPERRVLAAALRADIAQALGMEAQASSGHAT
jgi:1-acyl-sn-glycerol-3-phosphate acyltransferase